MPKRNLPAYSSATGKTYDSWDAMVEAEANGYCLIVVGTTKDGVVKFANVTGAGLTKDKARSEAAKMRRLIKTETWRKHHYRIFVRPAWKQWGRSGA